MYYGKCRKVIRSCKTIDQITVAQKYIDLWVARYQKNYVGSWSLVSVLEGWLDDKEREIVSHS